MNMRKIIAVLAAMLLLCAAIPMAAISVSAADNCIKNGTFDVDAGSWGKSTNTVLTVEDGALKATHGDDWAYVYTKATLTPNTDYVITFRAKADKGGFKINFNDTSWNSAKETVPSLSPAISTEWKEFELEFNSAGYDALLLFFQSNMRGADAQTIWLDDVVVAEKKAEVVEPEIPVAPELPEYAGDIVLEKNFDDGSTFSNGSNENGYMVFDATKGDWYNVYYYANALQNATKYVISFACKANKATNINVKINNNWKGDTFQWTTNVTTEWAYYSCVINTNELAELTSTALLMFTSNATAANGAIYHIDNVVVREYVEPSAPEAPEAIYSEDFEGEHTWACGNENASFEVISAGDAPVSNAANGNYVVKHTIPSNVYPYISDRTGISVQPNTDYIVSFDVLNTNANWPVQVIIAENYWLGGAFATSLSSQIAPATHAWETYTMVFNTGSHDKIWLGAKSQWANSTIYFDNFSITPYQGGASNDGYVLNGDFESGKLGWLASSNTEVIADPTGADKGNVLKTNELTSGVHMFSQPVQNLVIGKEYTLSFKVYGYGSASNTAFWVAFPKAFTTWSVETDMAFQKYNDYTPRINMNDKTGAWHYVNITFTAQAETAVIDFKNYRADQGFYYFDDIKIAEVEVKDPSNDGYIINGDFETGDLTGFNAVSGTVITDSQAHGGNYSVVSSNTASKYQTMVKINPINVTPGKNYSVSFWYRYEGANATGSGASFYLYMQDITNKVNIKSVTTYPNAADTWYNVTMEFNSGDYEQVSLILSNRTANDGGVYYFDDLTMWELKDPSNDGYIINGDFETGKTDPWTVYSGTAVSADAAHSGSFGLHVKNPTGNWNGTANQTFTTEVGKTYEITMWAKALSQGQNIQIKDGGSSGTNKASKYFANTEWTQLTFEYTAETTTGMINICGGGTKANEEIYVDDIVVVEKKVASFDGYIYNGDFETGVVAPWENLWGSCPTVEIVDGKDGYGLHIVSGQWKHVRQTNIAVEANTIYKVSAWAKNASKMSLLVKDGGDSKDLLNVGVNAGDEWTYFSGEVNTGDYTTIIFSLMGGAADAYGTFDNIVIEKIGPAHTCNVVEQERVDADCTNDGYIKYACECGLGEYTEPIPAKGHTYDNCEDLDCNVCGAVLEAAHHNLTYVPAVVPANCLETGYDEYWKCADCSACFGDAEASYQINPAWMFYTGDCVRPEGAADCATVPCEVCGNDVYGYGEHDVLACQGGTCSKCGDEIEGYGCANYDTPACEDGVCYYCGGFVAGFGHENGSWAACCDGECAYGCGLLYPATEDHIDADADDYCDNCWNHLNHDVDPCVGGECSICWTYIEGAHVYFDACSAICEVCGAEREISHNVIHVAPVAATCTTDGNIEYWYCDACGAAWLNAECTLNTNLKAVVLPASCSYGAVYTAAKEATCFEPGNVEYWYCANCDVYYADAACAIVTNAKNVIIPITHNIIAVAAKAATCTEAGNIAYWYCEDCGQAWLDEYCHLNTNLKSVVLPASCSYGAQYVEAKDATCYEPGNVEYWYCANCDVYYADAACAIVTNAKNVIIPITHNVIHVEAKAATCTEMGNIEHWYCADCGQAWLDEYCHLNTNLKAVVLPIADHTYDSELDAACNACGATRDVVAPVNDVKKSISEDVNGFAMLFDADVAGFAVKSGTYVHADYTNATYCGYKLLEQGVIATNGKATTTIKGERMYELEDGVATFAYRIVNIPADKLDVEITMTPYYIVLIDGVETTVYGTPVTGSFAEIAG